MTKQKSFKQKLTALVLLAVSIFVPVTSFFLASNDAQATTEDELSIGEEIAYNSYGTVIKDTICVKRWEVYDFTLYYMGTFEDIFVDVIHVPTFVTGFTHFEYTKTDQIVTNYSLTYNMSEKISTDFGVNGGISLKGFFEGITGSISINSSYSSKYEKALTVAETISYSSIQVSSETIIFDVDGINNPYNHYYGDVLMMFKANKFKLTLHKKQIAKHRKSALHSWGEYQVEEEWDGIYYFYSSYYNNSGNYVRKTGDLGTRTEYENMISNAGK